MPPHSSYHAAMKGIWSRASVSDSLGTSVCVASCYSNVTVWGRQIIQQVRFAKRRIRWESDQSPRRRVSSDDSDRDSQDYSGRRSGAFPIRPRSDLETMASTTASASRYARPAWGNGVGLCRGATPQGIPRLGGGMTRWAPAWCWGPLFQDHSFAHETSENPFQNPSLPPRFTQAASGNP